MQLEEVFNIDLNKYACFANRQNAILAVHDSNDYVGYNTRNSQVILYNCKTGRNYCIHRSQTYIISLLFTNYHFMIVQRNTHQILVFSLKTDKLKKKLTGHRSQVIGLSYCRSKQLFVSICHDVCIVWNDTTLSKVKTLKCSTSSFIDCTFSRNGHYLFTGFQDSTIFFWDLQTYESIQFAFDMKKISLASSYSSYLIVYNSQKIKIADISKKAIQFIDLDVFWDDYIHRVQFLDHFIVVQTNSQFYLAQIVNQHTFKIGSIKKITQQISQFIIADCGSSLLILNKEKNKISFMNLSVQKNGKTIKLGNPLTNEGFYCAGGYDQTSGCHIVNQLESYPYQQNYNKLEQINIGAYKINTPLFSLQKLRQFVRKHHLLPQKHRPLAYRYLLNLPINSKQFQKYQTLGRHQCVQMFQAKYPLKNRQLAQRMKDIISLLAHYSPVFSQVDNLPSIVFPFVCLFGNDQFLCFQILYRLFTNYLNFLFENFPTANIDFVQNLHQILQVIDIEMLNYLKAKNLSFTKLCWGLISNLFSTVFPRQAFLSIIDTLLVYPDNPQIIMFIVLGYLIYTRSQILKFQQNSDIDNYLETQHTVNIGKYIKIYLYLYGKHHKLVKYHFPKLNYQLKGYIKYQWYPKDVVKMYQGRRKLQLEQYRKNVDKIRYNELINKQMTIMAFQAKKKAQKEAIQMQAYIYHNQNQSKNIVQLPQPNRKQRIQKIQNLIEKLTIAAQFTAKKRQKFNQFIPIMNQNFTDVKDQQLQQLQYKLMNLLVKYNPNSFEKPLTSQPISMRKTQINSHQDFKTSVNAQLTNKMWQLQQLHIKNQQKNWSNDFLKSMNI